MRASAACCMLLSAACAGHLETRPLDPKTGRPDSTEPALEGVVYYQPQYMRVTYAFTEFVDKNGRWVGSSEERVPKCTSVIQKEEIQILPNFARPYVIRQTSGFLSANKFGVTLANGVLTGVNTESAPKAPELITATAGLIKAIGEFAPFQGLAPDTNLAACNVGPRITELRPVRPGALKEMP